MTTQVSISITERQGAVLHTNGAPSAVMIVIAPKFVPRLTQEDAVAQARLLKALADPTRLLVNEVKT